ncbi:MAG TPA: DivIVA domain-containing protein [Candidatus Cryosericum sp.]|nr:DivIVA domain-containing protein [Candidatus Cryosericum sp.]
MRTEDIVNKVFARSFMGYDIEQVDRFLDEIIENLERCEAEKKEMLTAMEYLLGKLEKGQKLPLAEMRKAIDSGKPAKKRALPPDCAKPETTPQAKTEKTAPPAAELEKRARAIARQASISAPKQARAPKVQRVVKNGAEKEEPKMPPKPAAVSGEDWFDELLVNLCERERQGYTPVKPEAAPDVPAKEPPAAPAEEAQTAREPVLRPQAEQRRQAAVQPAAEEPALQEPEAEEMEPAEVIAQESEETAEESLKANTTAPEQTNIPVETERT